MQNQAGDDPPPDGGGGGGGNPGNPVPAAPPAPVAGNRQHPNRNNVVGGDAQNFFADGFDADINWDPHEGLRKDKTAELEHHFYGLEKYGRRANVFDSTNLYWNHRHAGHKSIKEHLMFYGSMEKGPRGRMLFKHKGWGDQTSRYKQQHPLVRPEYSRNHRLLYWADPMITTWNGEKIVAEPPFFLSNG